MAKETVLITGASSGIGLELARLFAGGGSDLVLVARSETRLRELAGELEAGHGIRCHIHPADLASPGAPTGIQRALEQAGIAIDVLVNNAGFGAHGPFAELDLERQLAMLQVNVVALTHLTRLFLPAMIERGRGGVLNVGSLAGFQPGPLMSVYFATKAYVLHFSEGLAEELAGTGVTVTCLAPGPTRTGFADVAGAGSTRLFAMGTMGAAEVARIGYRGFRRGRTIVLPGASNRLSALAAQLSPRSWVRKVVKGLHGPA
jgi:uncharacterized protein